MLQNIFYIRFALQFADMQIPELVRIFNAEVQSRGWMTPCSIASINFSLSTLLSIRLPYSDSIFSIGSQFADIYSTNS